MNMYSELSVKTVRNVVVVPAPEIWPAGALHAGVFDSSGAILKDSLLYRNFSQVVFAPDTAPTATKEIEEPHLFAGYYINHFGHFLLEGLARTWATEAFPNMPLAWASRGPGSGWQRDICTQIGLSEHMTFLEGPTRFRELLIPSPGYRIRDYFHPDHAKFLASTAPASITSPPKRIWLSRQGQKGKGRIGDEGILEEILASNGWFVLRPETKSISEQLDLLSAADIVAGVEGSALHLPVLLENPPKVMIVLRRFDNENYRTIANARGFHMHDVIGCLEYRQDQSGTVHHFSDPKQAATIVQKIAQSEEEANFLGTRDAWDVTHYQTGPARFAPHLPARTAPERPKLIRRLKRKLLG